MLPVGIGVIPFAMITGVAAVSVGISAFPAFCMSFIVFAGASQLAITQLYGAGAATAVIIASAFIVNLRMLMYSATVAPHLRALPFLWKAAFAYPLTDHAFAASIDALLDERRPHRQWFYFGAATSMWAIWVAASAAGVLLGASIPEQLDLEFAVPLSLLCLLVPRLMDRPSWAAALTAGVVVLAARDVSYNLGLIIAACSGIAAASLVRNLST